MPTTAPAHHHDLAITAGAQASMVRAASSPGTPPNDTMKGPTDWFTGDVYIDMIPAASDPSRLRSRPSTFSPSPDTYAATSELRSM